MPTIEELIDALCETERGQIFLVNLTDTLDRHFLSASQVKVVCEEFINKITAGGYPIPRDDELADRLGDDCVANGLWKEGLEPILERHLWKREFGLSRVTSYSGFYYSVLRRRRGMPSIPDLPEPIDPSSGTADEIDTSDVNKVRRSINSQRWRALIVGNVIFDTHCIWLAPLPKLKNKIGAARTTFQADLHRDIIGLSHFGKGQHLVRLDLDLKKWRDWQLLLRRRPHGGGNGGKRFRVQYDGKECKCRWGRTVDLSRVATGNAKSLNGIPELLMERTSIPKEAVKVTYIGKLIHQPEQKDTYFLKRLRKKRTIVDIVTDLRRKLA